MQLGKLTGAARKDNPRKWDYAVGVPSNVVIKSVVWQFDTQSKNVATKHPSAPGYVWTSDGEKTVTVTVTDTKGNRAAAAAKFQVGKAVKPPVTTPPVTTPSTPSTQLPTTAAPSNLRTLKRGVFQITDFDKGDNSKTKGASNYGAQVNYDITGAGSSSTQLEIKPLTSSKAAAEPKVRGNGGGLGNPTNNMYILRVDGDNRTVRGLAVIGTPQKHLFNGVRFDNNHNLTVADFQVWNIPGNASGNPGETFLINFQRTSGKLTVKDLRVAGGAGALKSAAGIGFNSVKATGRIEGLVTSRLQFSAGIATWQQTGALDVYGWTHSSPTRSLGAERLAAPITIHDMVFAEARTTRGTHDATYTWGDHEAGDYKGGEIVWEFSSQTALERCLNEKRKKFIVLTNPKSVKQGIKKSVKVIVAGKDRTKDLLAWRGA